MAKIISKENIETTSNEENLNLETDAVSLPFDKSSL